MTTTPLTFGDSPSTFIWFYAYVPILIANMLLPVLLYLQTRRWPWLLVSFAQLGPYFFLFPALFVSTWDQKPYPVKYIDSAGTETIHTYTNWTGLIMVVAFLWFYIENRKNKIEPADRSNPL